MKTLTHTSSLLSVALRTAATSKLGGPLSLPHGQMPCRRPLMRHRRAERVVFFPTVHAAARARDFEMPENWIDLQAADMVVRLLTLRAVQQILVQLQEVNQAQAQYLSQFADDNQPSQGNKFLLKLLVQPPFSVVDPITHSMHSINPQALAQQILQVRGEMADRLAATLALYSSFENTAVLRKHLIAHTYTSGSSSSLGPQATDYRRGYNNVRPGLRPRCGPRKP